MKVFDTSLERKTANKFLSLLKNVYQLVGDKWKTTVAAIVTDASGETRKARQDFVKEFPSVVVLNCYAHQVILYFFQE